MTPAPPSQVVVIGASAGGLPAITEIIDALPAEFPAPILFISHMTKDRVSMMPDILTLRTELTVKPAEDGDILAPGTLYTAQSGHNVIVEYGVLRVVPCNGEEKFCPSIDMTMESAARAYRQNTILILLTGMLDDGVMGLQENWKQGGTTLVQDPGEADFPSMPLAAIARDHPDRVLTLDAIAARLQVLTGMSAGDAAEERLARQDDSDSAQSVS